ncbi:response regulator containing CheY-like receiver domain and AraC-type DNA-binding domain [Sphaerochaeta pleomorpha str. Grapes]|uniref:Response regulator containing CheY-like receiver domain and AraC-type DNA-binding domain n=1 Tax=Sphaerochaeta pleomorpha (strain ATCC BAA-1885 / DSM 22778 / Grapes) TaxID=158190 RepID=G8QWG0_SPHPG|nr:response regulator [Sphaerochaeta pleomorpha]AEV30536.1 response regulator containing CheY-like receiver domain and AraC-type DNA-binding domain [Sphaerochaeta pleomorpha str. Grapes]
MIKLLIADDESIEREILCTFLSPNPLLEIYQAENGRLAVTYASLYDVDVVLMDIEMPSLNGLEASQRILKDKPSTRIIFITAYSVFSYAREAVKLGVLDYILKPVDKEDVLRTVKRAVSQVEAERQLLAVQSSDGECLEEVTDKATLMMAKVKKYLEYSYMNYDLSLDSVSSLLNINSSYLSCIFKRCTGINFLDYITNLRIKAAKEHLADPFKSASEIATMVGYDSSSYFTRAFKKNTGLTPTEYRNQVGRGLRR